MNLAHNSQVNVWKMFLLLSEVFNLKPFPQHLIDLPVTCLLVSASPTRSVPGSLCSCFTVPSSSRWRRDPSTPSREKLVTPWVRTSSSGSRLTTKPWSVNLLHLDGLCPSVFIWITTQAVKFSWHLTVMRIIGEKNSSSSMDIQR